MVRRRLAADGLACEVCPDLGALLAGIAAGAGIAMVAEEALAGSARDTLLRALEAQEPWSDLPVLVLTHVRSRRRPATLGAVFERANVTLLERPVGLQLFTSSVRSALRARRRQYQMRHLYAELERAVQLSDMFVSILGHDLRTPIQAIQLSAQVILRVSPDANALRPAGRILASAERMARMIAQLLDFARLRHGGGIPLQVEPAHLGDLCRPIVQEIEDVNVGLTVTVVEAGDLAGRWDVDRLGQVVSNLVGNAVQHGEAGQPITLELDGTDAAAVCLRVHNSGAVAPEALPTLFEAFRRPASADSTRGARTGLGLGLYIAREIARAHGGDLAARSGDERTTFEVTLPRA
jgi:signal transduction histidine kinase